MLKPERIKAALAGKPVDRVPVSFWRHWPGDDQDPDALAIVTLDFQKRYDLDFIKIPVTSTFCVADYGVKHDYLGKLGGDRDYLERVIKKLEDWDRIEPLDIRKGTYGKQLKTLRTVLKKREAATPVVFTIFNPLAMAAYLAGDETLLVHLRTEPERVKRAVAALTETCAKFVKAVIDEGCDGIFLSSRFSSFEIMDYNEYKKFGRQGDLEVLKAASKGWFNILHLHGQHPMFEQLSDYPVQAVNWHDRTAYPDLKGAKKLFKGALAGGVEQFQTLHLGTPAEVEAQVKGAIKQTGGRRLIVTPGCTYPVDIPHRNLMAMRKAVEKFSARL